MARITKVEGYIKVHTETGGAFTLNIVGHGLKSGGGLQALGPYVGTLIADELRKVLADEPEIVAAVKEAPKPIAKPAPVAQPAQAAQPTKRGSRPSDD